MDLLNEFNEVVRRRSLFSQKDRLIVAVSGGVDSVVLAALCSLGGREFSIAHCNFQLRGDESERDERFVAAIAEKYQVPFHVKKFDTLSYSETEKLSVQESARKLRYQWFEELTSQSAGDVLLTAHHAGDNVETLLMHFFRGTGIHGLTGIPEKNKYIRRPLLGFTKETIGDFANTHKLDFVNDSSNNSIKYTRNFFRKEILPAIEKVYPQVHSNLANNILRFKGIERIYDYGLAGISKRLIRQNGNEIHIPVREFLKWNNPAVIYEIIKPYGFTERQVEELFKLAASDSGKYITSPGNAYRIIRHRHLFIITPVCDPGTETIIIEKNDREISFGKNSLLVEHKKNRGTIPPGVGAVACLDSAAIEYPLLLRKWKTSDYFYPLGMKKKKKISRFLIDQKTSRPEKENTWVLESGKRIIWVVGKRIDDRFKIEENSRDILKLTVR